MRDQRFFKIKMYKRFEIYFFLPRNVTSVLTIMQVPQQAVMGPVDRIMQAAHFFPPSSSQPLNGEQWAIVGAETQVS